MSLATGSHGASSHYIATDRLRTILEREASQGRFVKMNCPITMTRSEPEADVVAIRGERCDFTDRHPGPADVAFVGEIADDSLSRDRFIKKRIYAADGIAVYWIVNLRDRRIEVYSKVINTPCGPDYAPADIFAIGDNVPLLIDGQKVAEIPVREIIPEQSARPD